MQLDENYSIKKEGECVTLMYENTRFDEKKNKAVTSKDQWYFNNLASALKKYTNNVIDCSESIQEVAKKISELELQISNLSKQ